MIEREGVAVVQPDEIVEKETGPQYARLLAVIGPADAGLLAKVKAKANTELWQSLDATGVPHLVYRIGEAGPCRMHSGGLPTAKLAQLLEL
jgi:hypothetical protein